ncbi:MAG: type II toxin-antitoxin system PemK/MazF family toxin [Traorella sp.]
MISRGDVYYADLMGGMGSEQKGVRPVVIVQNNMGNKHSTTLIIVPISKKLSKPPLPTHVIFQDENLDYISMILCEQVRTIDKKRLKSKITHLSPLIIQQVDQALKISLNLE